MKTVSVRTYIGVYILLLGFLVLTLLNARWPLRHFSGLIAIGIALAKMMLIILYFMHIRYSSSLTRLFAVVGFFWFCILVVLVLSDYLSRGWLGQ